MPKGYGTWFVCVCVSVCLLRVYIQAKDIYTTKWTSFDRSVYIYTPAFKKSENFQLTDFLKIVKKLEFELRTPSAHLGLVGMCYSQLMPP